MDNIVKFVALSLLCGAGMAVAIGTMLSIGFACVWLCGEFIGIALFAFIFGALALSPVVYCEVFLKEDNDAR